MSTVSNVCKKLVLQCEIESSAELAEALLTPNGGKELNELLRSRKLPTFHSTTLRVMRNLVQTKDYHLA